MGSSDELSQSGGAVLHLLSMSQITTRVGLLKIAHL